MPVPDFQSLMLPALRVLATASPATTAQVRAALAAVFHLTDADLAELLPSGRQATFANRVAWAYSYLKQAGLISSPRRGTYEITSRGRETLAENPARIDIPFLSRFPEFQAFRQPSNDTQAEPAAPASITPAPRRSQPTPCRTPAVCRPRSYSSTVDNLLN